MQSIAKTVNEYIDLLPGDRKTVLSRLRETILKNLPEDFTEVMNYGMPGYVVPRSVYPKGYHCDSRQPLPFINFASQKNYISFYHMGLYEGLLLDWFLEKWSTVSDKKPDMGKCCIRFKKLDDIPYELIGELTAKISALEWIEIYEKNSKK